MQVYGIKKRLNIPEYKITEIISETETEIRLRLEPYKRKLFVCSGCGGVHKNGYHGKEESIAEDLPIFEKRTYLRVTRRRHVCPNDNRIYI
jgi:transposase